MTIAPASRRPGSRFLRRAGRALILVPALGLAACGFGEERAGDIPPAEFLEPATGIDYEVEIVGAPNDEASGLMEETLLLYRRQDRGAPSRAILKRRAEEDIASAVKVLKSFGYYKPEIEVEVVELPPEPATPGAADDDVGAEGGPVSRGPVNKGLTLAALTSDADADEEEGEETDGDATAQAPVDDGPRERALARMIIDPGPAFRLIRHDIQLVDVPEGPPVQVPAPGEIGSPVGDRADAATILETEAKVLTALLNQGRPWAKLEGRRAVADMEAATIEVETRVAPGPYAEYGRISVEGLDHVEPGHVNRYRVWTRGEAVDRRQLREYQSELMATELFDSVSVDVPRAAPDAGAPAETPVTVTVEEAKRRTVTAGVRYDTDDGPSVQGGFVHRNLWGEGERLRVDLNAGLIDQSLTAELRKPQFLRRRQDLTFDFEAKHEENDAYDETSALLGAGVERDIGRYWTVGAGGTVEYSLLSQDGREDDLLLYGIPAFVRYDGTDDLLNPTEGVRATVYGTPYYATRDRGDSQFFKAETLASGYISLDDEKKYVLAMRGRVGSIFSEDYADVPINKRFYSGGGGSIRGYQKDYIGPLDASNDPVGGRSVIEAGVELRAMVWGPVGAAIFAEGGSVSREVYPDFEDDPQFAAGVGVRYYSPVGPIRADIAFPLNARDVDDPFGFYFSIGQAY